jgi:hypothetical protein
MPVERARPLCTKIAKMLTRAVATEITDVLGMLLALHVLLLVKRLLSTWSNFCAFPAKYRIK